jgi:alpha/beta superfamily hydrolase
VALRLGCPLPEVTQLIAVGYPTKYKEKEWMNECSRPKVFIQSTNDEFGPLTELEPLVATLAQPAKLLTISAKDHFFVDALPALEETVLQVAVQPA